MTMTICFIVDEIDVHMDWLVELYNVHHKIMMMHEHLFFVRNLKGTGFSRVGTLQSAVSMSIASLFFFSFLFSSLSIGRCIGSNHCVACLSVWFLASVLFFFSWYSFSGRRTEERKS